MMKQGPPRGLSDPHALGPVNACAGEDILGELVGLVEEPLKVLDGGEDLDQPGIVIPERGRESPPATLAGFLQLSVGQRSSRVRTYV
jgi:hypothetical protein